MARRLPRKKDIVTDIKWDAVRAALDGEEWVADSDNEEMEKRSVYLGSVFHLYPSGKYYMPFACSNLDPCPDCNGTGQIRRGVKRRSIKKWQKARERCWRLADRNHLVGRVDLLQRHGWYRYWMYAMKRLDAFGCIRCNGTGSHEAVLDEIFREKLEGEADEHDCSIESGEGDPCDVFITEYRDVERPEDEEEDEEETDDEDA